MLRSVQITAELAHLSGGEGFHNLHWQKKLALSLDCFICGRTGRTTSFQYGQEHAACSGDDAHPVHPAAARIAAFDVTNEQHRTTLRAVVDYWWAPFHDAKRDRPSTALTRAVGPPVPRVLLPAGRRVRSVQHADQHGQAGAGRLRPLRRAAGQERAGTGCPAPHMSCRPVQMILPSGV
ncbi:hypothetical protein JCM4914_68210 [Streptomyces platensis subsp. malvinus]